MSLRLIVFYLEEHFQYNISALDLTALNSQVFIKSNTDISLSLILNIGVHSGIAY